MTSIANITRWRRQRLRAADNRQDDAPLAGCGQTARRPTFVAVMRKTIRLTWALAIILVIEIADFISVKIGRIR